MYETAMAYITCTKDSKPFNPRVIHLQAAPVVCCGAQSLCARPNARDLHAHTVSDDCTVSHLGGK